ncbi:transposase-like protein [Catenulispora sp. MAP12-49]
MLLVAVYYRTNLTMRQLGALMGVSAGTVCRTVKQVGPHLALAPARRRPDAAERLWIVDGTMIPVRDRDMAASSRNYRFSANVQVVVDADARLVIATGRPLPGNVNDAPAFRRSGIAEICDGQVVLADGAYWGTGCIVPHRKRTGRPLLAIQEADNTEHRRVRARVEHVFTWMKNYKILRDCRVRGDGLHTAVQAVATMHNLALAA